jgi:phytol kinase
MMINPWLGIGLVMLILGALQSSVSTLGRKYRLHPEIMRKVIHIIMGLICISLPWLFADVWPVLLLSGIASSWLIATKTLPVLQRRWGQALNCISRASSGDVWFCIGIGLLFWLTHDDWLLYVVPVLVLTCADAAAALIGVFYGRTFYTSVDGTKSLEGSLAFLIVAWVCSYVPLMLFGELGATMCLLASSALASSMMLLEALSPRGIDNILVSLGSMLVLKIAIHAALPQPVMLCVLALASIFGFLLILRQGSWQRYSLRGASWGQGAATTPALPQTTYQAKAES